MWTVGLPAGEFSRRDSFERQTERRFLWLSSVHWTCPGVHLESRLWALNKQVGERTSDMQSESSLSRCFFVRAGHYLSRELGTQGLQTGPKMVGNTSWCTFCFACFFRLYVTNSARQKTETKSNFYLIYSRKSKEWMGWGKICKVLFFWFAFLSVILKDQKGMLLPLSCVSPLLVHNHMNAENEEASFKSLRIFCMMTSIFTFSHTRKSHFSWSAT